jgi:hypothetical protein
MFLVLLVLLVVVSRFYSRISARMSEGAFAGDARTAGLASWRREEFRTFPQPAPDPDFVVARALSQQEREADTARDAVVPARDRAIDQVGTGHRQGGSLRMRSKRHRGFGSQATPRLRLPVKPAVHVLCFVP